MTETTPEAVRMCEEMGLEVARLEPREFFDRFIIGLADRCASATVLAYDLVAIRAAMVAEQGVDEEEADEHLSFNVLGAYVGVGTPVFVTKLG
jgi:hypothetical protein